VPKIVDVEQRRADLTDAAARLIARSGIESATMREVAAEAGLTTGALTHYFTDKHELLLTTFQASLFPGFTATRHALSKVLVSLDPSDPDRARVRADVSADHVIVDDAGVASVFTLDGYYDDRCVRTAGGCKIGGNRRIVLWSSGDRSVMDTARARALTDPQSRP
jgi:AcrR family transcriptional regulator